MRNGFTLRGGQVTLAKMSAPLDVRWSRRLPATPSSLTVSRDAAGRYFVSLLCDAQVARLPATNKVMAADLGIRHFLTFADDQPALSAPKFVAELLHRVRRLSRALSRKHKGLEKPRRSVGASRAGARAYCRFTQRFPAQTVHPACLRTPGGVHGGPVHQGNDAQPPCPEYRRRCLGQTAQAARLQGGLVRPHVLAGGPVLRLEQDLSRLRVPAQVAAAERTAIDVPGVRRDTRPRQGTRRGIFSPRGFLQHEPRDARNLKPVEADGRPLTEAPPAGGPQRSRNLTCEAPGISVLQGGEDVKEILI